MAALFFGVTAALVCVYTIFSFGNFGGASFDHFRRRLWPSASNESAGSNGSWARVMFPWHSSRGVKKRNTTMTMTMMMTMTTAAARQDVDGFDVYTEGCKIPRLNPFDASLSRIYKLGWFVGREEAKGHRRIRQIHNCNRNCYFVLHITCVNTNQSYGGSTHLACGSCGDMTEQV